LYADFLLKYADTPGEEVIGERLLSATAERQKVRAILARDHAIGHPGRKVLES
jgi:hypothetical protein